MTQNDLPTKLFCVQATKLKLKVSTPLKGTNKMDDRQLIKGCLENQKEHQKELFRRFSGKMLSVCRRYARHEMEAEDMLQDAFVKMFKNLSSFKFEGSFEGWLRRITINTAIKHCQKKAFSNELMGYEKLPENSHLNTSGAQMNEDFLLKLVSNLPEGYRLVFNLFAIEGYSHAEIAELLGITASTSRSQLVKARRMLQLRLAEIDNYHSKTNNHMVPK